MEGKFKTLFNGLRATNSAILGGAVSLTETRIISDVEAIELIPYAALVPFAKEKMPMNVPQVIYNYADKQTGKTDRDSFLFGKYYLYEGLAHHLEREIARQKGIPPVPESRISPEYTVMQIIGKTLYPGISNRHLLETASLALSYINPGETFVRMV